MSNKVRGACWQKDPSLCRLHGYASAVHTAQAKAAMENAADKYLVSYDAGNPDMDAFIDYRKTRIAYYATPEGQRAVQEEIGKLQGTSHVERLGILIGLREEAALWVDNFEEMNQALKKTDFNTKYDQQTGARRTLPLPPARDDHDWSRERVLSNFDINGTEGSFTWNSQTGTLGYVETDDIDSSRYLGKFKTEAEAVKTAEKFYNETLIHRIL